MLKVDQKHHVAVVDTQVGHLHGRWSAYGARWPTIWTPTASASQGALLPLVFNALIREPTPASLPYHSTADSGLSGCFDQSRTVNGRQLQLGHHCVLSVIRQGAPAGAEVGAGRNGESGGR